jgi:hypothetical protein
MTRRNSSARFAIILTQVKICLKNHMKNIHGVVSYRQSAIKNPDLTPEIDYPNFYCRACEKRYPTNKNFWSHLYNAHKMKKKTDIPSTIIHPNITPDVNRIDFYCEACERQYHSRQSYSNHLRRIHKILIRQELMKNPHLVPDISNPENYCVAGELKLSTKVSYRNHLLTVHNTAIPRSTTKQSQLPTPI